MCQEVIYKGKEERPLQNRMGSSNLEHMTRRNPRRIRRVFFLQGNKSSEKPSTALARYADYPVEEEKRDNPPTQEKGCQKDPFQIIFRVRMKRKYPDGAVRNTLTCIREDARSTPHSHHYSPFNQRILP